MTKAVQVCVVMGSKSDLPVMEHVTKTLKEFEVGYEVRILSAHRTPDAVLELSRSAKERGIRVLIAGAGGAAHLAGVIASSTTLPVLGVPIGGGALSGMDALLSTVQMPGGVPVATLAIGIAGAKNAALLALQILALSDEKLAQRLADFKQKQAEKIISESILDL